MGKNKRQKLSSGGPKKERGSRKLSRASGISKPQAAPRQGKKSKPHFQAQHSEPKIPFSPSDRILLIGEGDLSFAHSLVKHHKCKNVTATVFESRDELEQKYPHVGENIRALEEGGTSVKFGVDATRMAPWMDRKGKEGVGVMNRVFFNFPHVGGKSTDVNRQVRYNQELLVSFFKQALPSLAPISQSSTSSIIVTLFEGEPYTLWNIRDLARHSGLQVERSFRFQAKAYPGYKHARTLGVVKGKNGEDGGGWRGEERNARSYIFVRNGEASVAGASGGGKRKKDESSDEDEDDSEADFEDQDRDDEEVDDDD